MNGGRRSGSEAVPAAGARPKEAASHLPALDGIRGIAAITVVVSHSANRGLLPAWLGDGAGQTAVGLFFVLSGFLMTYLYAHKPIARLPDYARHRFARVVPLYLLLVFISILLPGLFFEIDTPAKIVEHLFFIFGERTLWTIPVEVQFYFLFALIWLAPRLAIPLLFLAQILTAGLFFFLHLPTTTLPFWLHFFLFGVLCGYAWRAKFALLIDRSSGYGWLGWPILLLAVLALPGLRHAAHLPVLPTGMDPLSVASVGLLFVGTLLGLGPLKGFAAGWTRWLGRISYSVYLIHFPILTAAMKMDTAPLVKFAVTIAATLVLATLSFNFFEDPIRRRLNGNDREPAPAGVLVTPSAP